MSEHDAHRALSDTARIRIKDAIRDPLEATQRMSERDWMKRMDEAIYLHRTQRERRIDAYGWPISLYKR
jgi:hypothetical protein